MTSPTCLAALDHDAGVTDERKDGRRLWRKKYVVEMFLKSFEFPILFTNVFFFIDNVYFQRVDLKVFVPAVCSSVLNAWLFSNIIDVITIVLFGYE